MEEGKPPTQQELDDDWGGIDRPERPPYVYNPEWWKACEHLLEIPSDPTYDPLQNYKLFFRYNHDEEEDEKKPPRVAPERPSAARPAGSTTQERGFGRGRLMQRLAESWEEESKEIGIEINLEKSRIDVVPPTEIPDNNWTPKAPFQVQMVGILDDGITLVRLEDKITKNQYKLYQENIQYTFGAGRRGVTVPKENLKKGSLVFVKSKKTPGKYMRCQIIQLNEDAATCKDLDTWDHESVPLNDVYYLPPTSFEVPFLIQQCRLKGLEFWCVGKVLQELFKLLPTLGDKAEILEYLKGEDNICVVTIKVTFTKVRIQHPLVKADSMDLADLFRTVITNFTRIPRQLFRGSLIERAYIGMVDKEGNAWISLQSSLARRLGNIGENPKIILARDEYNFSLDDEEPLSDFEYGYFKRGERRFLARFDEDRLFFRFDVSDDYKKGDKEVRGYYVDFGNTETISVDDIIPSAFVDPLINLIPPQVFVGKLNGIQHVKDVDEFFEYITIQKPQRIMVSGFERNAKTIHYPLLDAYTMLDPVNAPTEWTWANALIVEKNLATPTEENIFEAEGAKKTLTINVPAVSLSVLGVEDNIKKQRCVLISQHTRFYSSFRLEDADVDDENIALNRVKSLKKSFPKKKQLPPIESVKKMK